jgi:hypothetical protein
MKRGAYTDRLVNRAMACTDKSLITEWMWIISRGYENKDVLMLREDEHGSTSGAYCTADSVHCSQSKWHNGK